MPSWRNCADISAQFLDRGEVGSQIGHGDLGGLGVTGARPHFDPLLLAVPEHQLTMLTTQYAKRLKGIRVNAADPCCTATNFSGHSGPQSVIARTGPIDWS